MKKYLQMANQEISQLPNSGNVSTNICEEIVSITLPEHVKKSLLEQSKAEKIIAIVVEDKNNVPVLVTPSDVSVIKKGDDSQESATPRGGKCCSFVFNGVGYVICF